MSGQLDATTTVSASAEITHSVSAHVAITGGGSPSPIELAALTAAVEQTMRSSGDPDTASRAASAWNGLQWTRASWSQQARSEAVRRTATSR